MGLTGYYRRFVANYGSITAPLHQMIKGDGFQWTNTVAKAFERLKHAMMTVLVFTLPNFSKPLIVETDASRIRLGPVLSQNQRPIAFYSHTLLATAQAKFVYKRELMVVVFAVQRWRPYLLGRKFTV